MLDKYLNKNVKIVATIAASTNSSIKPVAYYGKMLNYNDEFIEIDVEKAIIEIVKFKVDTSGNTLINRNFVVTINEI